MLRFTLDAPAGLTRRDWLRAGALGGLGLSAAGPLAAAPPAAGKARSVLVVFAAGGQSQIDTFDPKPDAPAEVRGLFRPIATRVPGTRICEHLPRLARLADRYALVRSLSHDDLDHGSACYLALTGHFHPQKSSNPPPRPTDQPTLGAIVRRARPAGRAPFVAAHLNGPLLVPEDLAPGQYGGFLGPANEPLQLGDVSDGPAVLRSLARRRELPEVRLDRRRALLGQVEAAARALEGDRAGLDLDARRRQAYDLLAAADSRLAFDLSREPRRVREGYGLHHSGQACLLARRLVEAGVPFVTVFYAPSIRGQDRDPDLTDAYGWDTHNDIFEALRDHLLPRFDATFAYLLEDLRQRGLLETTLVVAMGEFGRAPLVALEKTFAGSTPGRKHWAAVYSALFAGAGVQGGKLIGASDKRGAYPTTTSYSPADVAATLLAALGIDPQGMYRDALDRPHRAAEGRVIRALYQG